jgi:hypothetical protein
MPFDGSNSLAFSKALHRNFGETLADAPGRGVPIRGLMEDCFRIFDRKSENAPGLACHGGCASCCAIRVAATAPEILLIARAIRSCSEAMGLNLRQKVDAADSATRRLDEQSRMTAAPCPFIEGGLCVI